MSNAITDILNRADWTKATPSGYLDDKALERKAEALQALYEAVKGAMPKEVNNSTIVSSVEQVGWWCNGRDDALAAVLTNLSLLFGMADAGGLEKPSDNLQSVATKSLPTVERRALEWLLGGDTGVSSKTLCGHMLGIPVDWTSAPSDAGDRGRCIRLLERIPEWIPRLDELMAYEPEEALVISSRGTEVRSNGWLTQVPLIRHEMGNDLAKTRPETTSADTQIRPGEHKKQELERGK